MNAGVKYWLIKLMNKNSKVILFVYSRYSSIVPCKRFEIGFNYNEKRRKKNQLYRKTKRPYNRDHTAYIKSTLLLNGKLHLR